MAVVRNHVLDKALHLLLAGHIYFVLRYLDPRALQVAGSGSDPCLIDISQR